MIKKLILKALYGCIELLEKLEYRNISLDEYDINKKIIESIDTSDLLVKTDTGYSPVGPLHKTQPYTTWSITTKNGLHLDCADNHIVFMSNLQEVFVRELKIGDLIKTEFGDSEVTSIEKGVNKLSMYDLTVNDVNHRFYTNGILSHNTVTSAIYIAWYLCFNVDKNVLVLANRGATAKEIVDKVKHVLKNLPFFLKPGVVVNNVMEMTLDNGCRLIAQTTTKSSAIGFTIHLLYLDEFAHIQHTFLDQFYRSVYPTISSSKISRVIITSTPNGMNKFWEIYKGAIEKTNEYNPIRIDWWQIPGRDELWKKNQIANLGSEEMFNQEYGNQFLSSERLLIDSPTLKFLEKTHVEFKWQEIEEMEELNMDYKCLTWHPNYELRIDKRTDKFVFSVDIADGRGGDYTIINIFKIMPMSKVRMRKIKAFSDESTFFELRQVGLFRSNKHSVQDLSKILETLVFEVFGDEQVKIVMEMNFKGFFLYEKFSQHEDFYEEIFLHTKHSQSAKHLAPGINVRKDNKLVYCQELSSFLKKVKIITQEKQTFLELSSFGVNDKGSYSSQLGHDDCHHKDTLITTKDGLKPIIDVKIGDYVLTHLGRWRKVTKIGNRFADKIYKISSTGKEDLMITDNHRMYLKERNKSRKSKYYFKDGYQWVNVKEGITKNHYTTYITDNEVNDISHIDLMEYSDSIEENDRLYVPRYNSKETPNYSTNSITRYIEVDDLFCWVLGYYLAEGTCTSHEVSFTSHQDEQPFRDKIKEFALKIGATYTEIQGNGNFKRVIINSKIVTDFFRNFSVGENKHVPLLFKHLPKEKLLQIAIGYLLGDGRFSQSRLTASSISPNIAYFIYDCLIKNNYHPIMMKRINYRYGIKNKDSYMIRLNESEKIELLNMISNILKGCKNINEYNIPQSNYKGHIKKDGDYILGKIQKIEELEHNDLVYSLEVEEDHSYIANGNIVHNCVMTLVNLVPFLESADYPELVGSIFDDMEDNVKENINEQMNKGDRKDDSIDLSFLRNLNK